MKTAAVTLLVEVINSNAVKSWFPLLTRFGSILWWQQLIGWSSFMKLHLVPAPTFCSGTGATISSSVSVFVFHLFIFSAFLLLSTSLNFQVWCFPPMETFTWLLSVMTSCTLSTTHGPISGLSLTHRCTDITLFPGTRTHWLLFISRTFDSQAVKHLVQSWLIQTKMDLGFFVSVEVHKESRKKSEAEEVRDI